MCGRIYKSHYEGQNHKNEASEKLDEEDDILHVKTISGSVKKKNSELYHDKKYSTAQMFRYPA